MLVRLKIAASELLNCTAPNIAINSLILFIYFCAHIQRESVKSLIYIFLVFSKSKDFIEPAIVCR